MSQITPTPLIPAGKPVIPESPAESAIGALIDIVNPLQHIPFVSTLYRAVTGDTISAGAKIIGGGIFGGIGGVVSSMADTAFEAATGNSFGDTVMTLAEDATDAMALPGSSATVSFPALASDNGTALAEVNLVRMAGMETSTEAEPLLGIALNKESLGLTADSSLGLTNAYKQTQLLSQLDETTLSLKS